MFPVTRSFFAAACFGSLLAFNLVAADAKKAAPEPPVITPGTQEQFVAQMANLELIGGVSFKKGCYPGQEIVARMQYLGKLKRRMYLAHVAGNVNAGDELYSAEMAVSLKKSLFFVFLK